MNDAIDASIPRQKQKWKRGKVHRLGDMIPVITHQGVQGGKREMRIRSVSHLQLLLCSLLACVAWLS